MLLRSVCAFLDLLGTVFPSRGTVDISVFTGREVVTLSVVLVARNKVEVGLSTHREGAPPAATVSRDQIKRSNIIDM